MITLRLDPKLEQKVNHTAKNLGLSKSELIRKSLIEYIEKRAKQNAWDAGRDLFGNHASGREDLSSNRKEILRSRIKAKRK